jgi:TonB family protein
MARGFVLVFLLLLASGCRSTQLQEETVTPPQLLFQVPLPPWPYAVPSQPQKLELMILIDTSGAVLDARLPQSSGVREWDEESLRRVRQWRFTPPLERGQPVARWVHLSVRVHFEEPLFMPLAELVCQDRSLADSLSALLESGESPEQLVGTFSKLGTRLDYRLLGTVNVRSFPSYIQQQLLRLGEEQCTPPLPRGREYVIFKRLRQTRIP